MPQRAAPLAVGVGVEVRQAGDAADLVDAGMVRERVTLLLHVEVTLHAGRQHQRAQRLGDEIHGAERQTPDRDRLLRNAGQQHDRDIAGGGRIAEVLNHAVDNAGILVVADVERDQIGRRAVGKAHGLACVVGGLDIAPSLEGNLEDRPICD